MEQLTTRKQQLLKTRQTIFDCATALFAEQSYEQVKISDICRRAGVSVGAFYHHFPSKESILNEGYREFDRTLEEAWQAYSSPSHLDAIRFLAVSQLHSMEVRGHGFSTQFFKNQLTISEKYILDKERFFYQTLLQQVQEETAAGGLLGAPEEITDDILRSTRGVIYDWCLNAGSYGLLEQGLRSLEMVLCFYRKDS